MFKYQKYFLVLIFLFNLILGTCQTTYSSYVKAPFSDLDTLATNDWWNRKTSEIIDMKVPRDQVVAFGIYTVSNNTLKLTAQLFPLYPKETKIVRLHLYLNNQWKEVQSQKINEIGWSTLFRIENWDMSQSVKYKITHGQESSFEGTIRRNPYEKSEITMAALSCNSNKDRGDRDEYVSNINSLNPDIIFFAVDQCFVHRE